MDLDKRSMPRFWYLPRGEKAVVVMTGDDHAVGGTATRFQAYKDESPAGCSVALPGSRERRRASSASIRARHAAASSP